MHILKPNKPREDIVPIILLTLNPSPYQPILNLSLDLSRPVLSFMLAAGQRFPQLLVCPVAAGVRLTQLQEFYFQSV